MDQILHRKLIIEKNNLQLEVAKANKEIAKLMETVQQYEAVLASLDEADIKNPDTSSNQFGKKGDNLNTGIPTKLVSRGSFPTKPVLRGNNQPRLRSGKRSVQEATLVRGAEAIKLQAEKSGKKLPTAAEAAKEMEEIKAAKELDQAGLGKLKKSRLSIMNRLDKGKELGEYGSAKERADNANLARLQRKSGINLGIRGTHRESGGSVTPAGEGAEQRRMRQQEKTIQKFGN